MLAAITVFTKICTQYWNFF